MLKLLTSVLFCLKMFIQLLTTVRRIMMLEKKWSTYELELIALVQALKQWHTYLVHRSLVVNTDNHSLKYLHTSAKVN